MCFVATVVPAMAMAQSGPVSAVDISGNWNFVQYWEQAGSIASLTGGCAISKTGDNLYEFTFSWMKENEKRTSRWTATVAPNGLILVAGLDTVTAGIVLGVDNPGVMKGIVFNQSKSGRSGTSGAIMCRAWPDCDTSVIHSWRSPDAAVTVKDLSGKDGVGSWAPFKKVLDGWIAQLKPEVLVGGTVMQLSKPAVVAQTPAVTVEKPLAPVVAVPAPVEVPAVEFRTVQEDGDASGTSFTLVMKKSGTVIFETVSEGWCSEGTPSAGELATVSCSLGNGTSEYSAFFENGMIVVKSRQMLEMDEEGNPIEPVQSPWEIVETVKPAN